MLTESFMILELRNPLIGELYSDQNCRLTDFEAVFGLRTLSRVTRASSSPGEQLLQPTRVNHGYLTGRVGHGRDGVGVTQLAAEEVDQADFARRVAGVLGEGASDSNPPCCR